MMDDEIREESDGTFTIVACDFFNLSEDITEIPTRVLAERIVAALWDAEAAGAEHYAGSLD